MSETHHIVHKSEPVVLSTVQKLIWSYQHVSWYTFDSISEENREIVPMRTYSTLQKLIWSYQHVSWYTFDSISEENREIVTMRTLHKN
jgi:hypothetical protein